LHGVLNAAGLTVWDHGTVSGRVPGADVFVITSDAVGFEQPGPESLLVCDLSGRVVQGPAGGRADPAPGAATHARLYRELPHVGGVVHTHSPYATAWAARGEAIPCVLAVTADEFGGAIPTIAPEGDDEAVGDALAALFAQHRSRAALVPNHGPFAVGRDARDAVRAAVLVEDAARTVQLARAGGAPLPLNRAVIEERFAAHHRAGAALQGAAS
jgi:L-ribulose-5-phosphate 4-epimerase